MGQKIGKAVRYGKVAYKVYKHQSAVVPDNPKLSLLSDKGVSTPDATEAICAMLSSRVYLHDADFVEVKDDRYLSKSVAAYISEEDLFAGKNIWAYLPDNEIYRLVGEGKKPGTKYSYFKLEVVGVTVFVWGFNGAKKTGKSFENLVKEGRVSMLACAFGIAMGLNLGV